MKLLVAAVLIAASFTSALGQPQIPEPGTAKRIAGEHARAQLGARWAVDGMAAEVTVQRAWPSPTSPGAIELKTYPAGKRMSTDLSNGTPWQIASWHRGFGRLEDHVPGNPPTGVPEMRFKYDAETNTLKEGPITSAYVLGATSTAVSGGDVIVSDTPSKTWLSFGVKGYLTDEQMLVILQRLEAVAEQQELELSDEARWIGYNSPRVRRSIPWFEIQIAVESAEGAS